MGKYGRVGAILLALWLLGGCALVKLKQDVQFSRDSCLLFGEIVGNAPLKQEIIVVAYSGPDDRPVVEDYAVLSERGPYELLVRGGHYRLFAFADVNGNLAHDPGEWAASYGKTISPQRGGVLWGLDMELSGRSAPPAPALADRLLAYSGGRKKPSTSAGSLANLDDPAFSAQQGEKGFWAPLDFFRLRGANVYFLEPYDSHKTPVLLVHGAAGSPQDWRYFIDALDRSRYQPWIFYYPSGARLDTVSLLLRKKLYDLEPRYRFDRLYVVAHSMGGLVARSALIEPDRHNRAVKLFVSLSTPWGGEPRAKTGVEHSPAVIPSWKDMEPDSDFIRHVYSKQMPEAMRYYLFFGHKGGGSLFRQNNDNTVTLESMLDSRAQADALKVTGFNEDHLGILNSAEVIAAYRASVEATEANLKKTLVDTHGYVDILKTFAPRNVKPPTQMAFVLVPRDGKKKETQIKVNPLLERQETGAIEPGDYEVSLCALGFKTEPANHPLSVKGGKISEARFVMTPQGMAAGIITASASADDSFWGHLPTLPSTVKIRTIRLEGGGISRVIRPADNLSQKDVLKTFLASRDYAHENYFSFFGLPGGAYTLSIEADGCEPYAKTVEVKPGEFAFPSPFRLTTR